MLLDPVSRRFFLETTGTLASGTASKGIQESIISALTRLSIPHQLTQNRESKPAKPLLKKIASRKVDDFKEGTASHQTIQNPNIDQFDSIKLNSIDYLTNQIILQSNGENFIGLDKLQRLVKLFFNYVQKFDPNSEDSNFHEYKISDITYSRERVIGEFCFLNGFVYNTLFFDDILEGIEPKQKVFLEKEGTGTIFAETHHIQDGIDLYKLEDCYETIPPCEYSIVDLKDFGKKPGGRFCGYPIAGRPIIAMTRNNDEDSEQLYALQESIHMRNFINYETKTDHEIDFQDQKVPYLQINEYLSDIGSIAFLGSHRCLTRILNRCSTWKHDQEHYLESYAFSDNQLCKDLLEYIENNLDYDRSIKKKASDGHIETINKQDLVNLFQGDSRAKTTIIQKYEGRYSATGANSSINSDTGEIRKTFINELSSLFIQEKTKLQVHFYQKFKNTHDLLQEQKRSTENSMVIVKNMENPKQAAIDIKQ